MPDSHDPFSWSDPVKPEAADTEYIELVHRVFRQNPDGQRLLLGWMHQFLYTPRTDMEPDKYKIGYMDGQAAIVQMVYQSIMAVETAPTPEENANE